MKFDLTKTLLSGLKYGATTLLSLVAITLADALTVAQTYQPEGSAQNVVMTYIVAPVLAFVAGAIRNAWKHRKG